MNLYVPHSRSYNWVYIINFKLLDESTNKWNYVRLIYKRIYRVWFTRVESKNAYVTLWFSSWYKFSILLKLKWLYYLKINKKEIMKFKNILL